MKIKKPWVSWEEFEKIQGGDWTPHPHTHVKADVVDTPWAWADILKAGSNLTDLATRQHVGLTDILADQHHPQSHTLASHSTKPHSALTGIGVNDHHAQLHASAHHVGGGDLVNHDSLTGFVANEHINHTSVSMIAGSGLSGGGTIAASRTFNLGLLTAAWDAGSYQIRALKFYSDQATGTPPLTVLSTTLVDNLNSDLWDNQDLPALESNKFLTNDGGVLKWMAMGAGEYHNLLSAAHPDTVAGTCAQGDIITGQAADISTYLIKDAGLGTDDGEDWTGVTNIYASDNVKASVDLADGIASSKILATTFGFNLPSNATVLGIKVSIEKRANTANVKDNSVRIIKGGVISGDQKASTDDWPASDAYKNYGSDSDLWGLGWSYSDINAANFGVSISVVKASGFAIASIDHIRITVFYTTPGYGWKKLAKGTDGKILQLVGGYPAWTSTSGTHTHVKADITDFAHASAHEKDGGDLIDTLADLTVDKLTMGSYYLNSSGLVANNKVADSDLWDGYQFADYLNQAVKNTSTPTFAKLTCQFGSRYSYLLTLKNTSTEADALTVTEHYLKNASAANILYAQINVENTVKTADSETGTIQFNVRDAGAWATRMMIRGNDVGIGKTPTEKLDVNGNVMADTARFTDLTDGYIPYHVSDASGLANSPLRTDGTNVGIGTGSSAQKLEVNGNISTARTNKFLFLEVLGGAARAYIRSTAGEATGDDPGDYNSLIFNASSEAMKIKFDGKVGIGKEPTQLLDVNGKVLATAFKLGSYELNSLVANNKVPDSDKWDGYEFADYLDQAVKQASSPTFVKLTLTQATGVAPLAVSSQTLVSSLNSDLWDNQDCPSLESGKFLTNDGSILKWMEMGAGEYHNLLSVAHPDTVTGTCAQGDIITGQSADILAPSTKDAGLGTDDGEDWTGVTNIYASDNVKASVDLADGIASSKILATTFGFSLPSNATIQGIKVSIEKRANTANVKDNSVRIIKGGVISGDQKASTDDWPAADAYKNYGSDTDLWGLGWSYSDINASNFGVSISVVKASGFAIASIDHIRITVYYTTPGYGWKKLVKGTDGQILQLVSGYPAWTSSSGSHTHVHTDITDWGDYLDQAVKQASNVTFALLQNTGGAKLEIQNSVDGGSSRGIFLWSLTDTNWGIYMGTAGAGKSLAGGVACSSISGRTSHVVRFRANSSTQSGFIWENDDEVCLMDLESNTGNLHVRGGIYPGNQNDYYLDTLIANNKVPDSDKWDGYQFADYIDQAIKQASNVIHASITVGNTGLHILDTNASHDLIIKPGSDLSADRILTLTTGNVARTITLSGNPTLSDWFNQSVKSTVSPTFAGLTLTGNAAFKLNTFKIATTGDGGHTWIPFTNGMIYLTSWADLGDADIIFRKWSVAESYEELGKIRGSDGYLVFPGLLLGSYHLNSSGLVANNKIADSDKWDGYQFADYLDQAVKQASSPTFVTAKLTALTNGYIPYHVSDASGLANSPLRTDGTNIGIGTGSPGVKLEVNGNIGIGRIAGAYTFRETVGGAERAGMHSTATNDLIFKTGAAVEHMRILSSGYVGIGKTPTCKLDVNGKVLSTAYKLGSYELNTLIANNRVPDSAKLTASGFYLDTLIANNRVPDSYKWNGYTPAGLTVGHVLKATGAASFAFQANNLDGISDVDLNKYKTEVAYDVLTRDSDGDWCAQEIETVVYKYPYKSYEIEWEFWTASPPAPWAYGPVSGGAAVGVAASSHHPGSIRANSGGAANSGYYWVAARNNLILSGKEQADFCFKTGPAWANRMGRFGFQDSITIALPTDGAYLDLNGRYLTGKTRASASGSTTGTGYNTSASTWYRGRIIVNSDATQITFFLYDAAGNQLWTNNLTTNIPTAATGFGALGYYTAAASGTHIFTIDLAYLVCSRGLTR